jgi:hypothetical protein
MIERRVALLLVVIAGLAGYLVGTVTPTPPLAAQQPAEQCFPETGKCVRGDFLTYWRANGGLRQQGLPISDEMVETQAPPPAGDGKTYTVQYFERSRFERHPENQPPNDVLLGLLGSEQYAVRYPAGSPSAPPGPVPTPAPSATTPGAPALSVATSRSYRDSILGLVVAGELVNNGGDASDIRVVASVIDTAGNTVATDSDSPSLLILGNGKRVGFLITIHNAPQQYAELRFQVESQPPGQIDRDFYYGDLVVEGATFQPPTTQSGYGRIVGQVRNTGSRATEVVTVVAVAVAGDNSVLDANDVHPSLRSIPPGGTSPFELTWFGQRMSPAAIRYTVWGSPQR